MGDQNWSNEPDALDLLIAEMHAYAVARVRLSKLDILERWLTQSNQLGTSLVFMEIDTARRYTLSVIAQIALRTSGSMPEQFTDHATALDIMTRHSELFDTALNPELLDLAISEDEIAAEQRRQAREFRRMLQADLLVNPTE